MSFSILGLGTAVPPDRVSQQHALEMSAELICENARQERLLRMLFRKSGVEHRRTVLPWRIGYTWKQHEGPLGLGCGPTTADRMRMYDQYAAPLARRAAAAALKNAELGPRDVTHLITVSCTGFGAPGVDVDLIRSLGLRPTTQRVHVGYMGCHGAINGLRVARGLAAGEANACILLVAVELCSLHYRLTWDDEGIIGNALFADGAAALVCGHRAQRRRATWQVPGTGSFLIPDSAHVMSWRIGNHGFEMRLSSRVPVLIEEHLSPWMSAWLDGFGYTIDRVGAWAVHPGGPKIVDAVEKALRLPPNACSTSRQVLRQLGNMSSPTVLFILEKLQRETRIPDLTPRGSTMCGVRNAECGTPYSEVRNPHATASALPIVILGFGPGLTAEAALLLPPD